MRGFRGEEKRKRYSRPQLYDTYRPVIHPEQVRMTPGWVEKRGWVVDRRPQTKRLLSESTKPPNSHRQAPSCARIFQGQLQACDLHIETAFPIGSAPGAYTHQSIYCPGSGASLMRSPSKPGCSRAGTCLGAGVRGGAWGFGLGQKQSFMRVDFKNTLGWGRNAAANKRWL